MVTWIFRYVEIQKFNPYFGPNNKVFKYGMAVGGISSNLEDDELRNIVKNAIRRGLLKSGLKWRAHHTFGGRFSKHRKLGEINDG